MTVRLFRHCLFALRFVLGVMLLTPSFAFAVAVDEQRFDDPALEQRVQDVSRTLRCLVCQNQSIEDSDADLAKDLRAVVRERIGAGDTDEEIRAFMVDRYGEWVLMRPPVSQRTYALWLGPLAIVLLGLIGVATMLRRRGRDGTIVSDLSDAERAKVAALLNRVDGQAPDDHGEKDSIT